jgi:hypothetical protein
MRTEAKKSVIYEAPLLSGRPRNVLLLIELNGVSAKYAVLVAIDFYLSVFLSV